MATAEQARLPRRAEHVISRELDGEFVVLNTKTDEAHQFDGAVAAVWRATGGAALPADLALDQLDDIVAHLLDLDLLVPDAGTSRRALMRAGAAGGAALAVAGVQSLVLPQAAWALSNDLPVTTAATFNIAKYVNTVTFTLTGGGGAGGSSDGGAGGAGGVGGRGASITGTLTFIGTRTAETQFTVVLGGGGQAATGGASSYSQGGSATNTGGGGGASVLFLGTAAGTPLIVAGGGGGGGRGRDATAGGAGGAGGALNADGSSTGSNGGSPSVTTTNTTTAITLTPPALGTAAFNTGQDTATFSNTANVTNLAVGDWLQFSASSNGLTQNTPYRVLTKASATTVTLEGATAGSTLNISGNNNSNNNTATRLAITISSGSPTIRFTAAHGLVAGDVVRFSGVGGGNAGIANGTDYYVLSADTTTTLTISATSGGTTITPGANGYATGASKVTTTTTTTVISNGGRGGATSSGGTATVGAGGTGAGGTDGSAGSIAAGRPGGTGGVNSGSADRTGGGGGGGYAPGGGGEAGVGGANNSPGAGGGGGSSFYQASTALSAGVTLTISISSSSQSGGAGGAGATTNTAGSSGSGGTVSLVQAT